MKKCNLSKLLLETPETYYWIGFILADGHIENQTRLSVTLANKDINHLLKLKDFLGIETLHHNKNGTSYICGMDSKIIRQFSKKFNIVSNKTQNPANVSNIKDSDLLLALKIGFIDGDGSIGFQSGRKDCILRIKCHNSWEKNLEYLYGNCKINNQGYANVNIGNSDTLKDLKKNAIRLNLPFLTRKWDKIDLNFNSKYNITKSRVKIVKEKLNLGWSQRKIRELLGMSASGISLLISRNNLKNESNNS